jgi:hypothetical protein
MNAVRPFFLLVGRASVLWLSAIGVLVVAMIVAGVARPDERLGLYIDAVFFAAFAFPAFAGWLAGAIVREFQHTTFAAVLPHARFRIASGFLIAGLAVTVVVVGWIALKSSTPQNLPVLFVIGLGAYCLGGILMDTPSAWITTLNFTLTLLVIVSSRELARTAGDHPWMTAVVCFGIGVLCCSGLFSRSTFRRRPFRATKPFPGRFSLERTRHYERRRMVQEGPKSTGWRAGYLGTAPWSWVRAAVHEVHGFRGWKDVSRINNPIWGFGILVLLHAWAEKGDMRLGEAVGRTIYDALFRSPHQPLFGEKGGPFLYVAVVLAAVGFATALFSPVALNDGMTYPLSRRQRAQILFRGGLVDMATFLLFVSPFLYAVGHLTGWLVGYELRFDFMPFFFRVLMVSLILMPLGHWGRFRLQSATRRRAGNTLVGVVFGITGFVIAVIFWAFVSPRLFGSPAVELATLAAALLVSQLIYRHKLTSYYRTADLI